jgi:hypothetical protein
MTQGNVPWYPLAGFVETCLYKNSSKNVSKFEKLPREKNTVFKCGQDLAVLFSLIILFPEK